MRVAIVCDQRPEAGRGHRSRMQAMAEEGARRGHWIITPWFEECRALTRRFGAIIVDDYRATAQDLGRLAGLGRLIVFDDWQMERLKGAALVIAPGAAPGDLGIPNALVGLAYAPIREDVAACGVDWHDGMITHGGQISLEAAYLGYRQKIEPSGPDVMGNVRRLLAGEVPDGKGAARAWEAIERL